MAGDSNDDAATGVDLHSSATARIAQLSKHLDVNNEEKALPRRRKRQGTKDSTLPADYADVLGHLRTLKAIANNPGPSNTGYVRQKQAGKLWVRERVEKLLDEKSFIEVGSASGTVKWKYLGGTREEPEEFVPSNNVQGTFAYRCNRDECK